MNIDIPIMKGSICPICRSQMYLDQTGGKAVLRCSIVACEYNNKESRDAYFREKHKSLIINDVMHRMKDRPKLKTLLDDKEPEK